MRWVQGVQVDVQRFSEGLSVWKRNVQHLAIRTFLLPSATIIPTRATRSRCFPNPHTILPGPPVVGRTSGSSLPVSSFVLLFSPNAPSSSSHSHRPLHFTNHHRYQPPLRNLLSCFQNRDDWFCPRPNKPPGGVREGYLPACTFVGPEDSLFLCKRGLKSPLCHLQVNSATLSPLSCPPESHKEERPTGTCKPKMPGAVRTMATSRMYRRLMTCSSFCRAPPPTRSPLEADFCNRRQKEVLKGRSGSDVSRTAPYSGARNAWEMA